MPLIPKILTGRTDPWVFLCLALERQLWEGSLRGLHRSPLVMAHPSRHNSNMAERFNQLLSPDAIPTHSGHRRRGGGSGQALNQKLKTWRIRHLVLLRCTAGLHMTINLRATYWNSNKDLQGTWPTPYYLCRASQTGRM